MRDVHPHQRRHMRPGESLIEVIVATAILIMIVTGFVRLAIGSYDGVRRGGEETIAASYAQEGLEAARSIARGNFANVVDGPHGLLEVGNVFTFSGTGDLLENKYQRTVTVSAVQRDTADVRVVSGGTVDPFSKDVESAVTWTTQAGGQRTITVSTELTQWNLWRWVQTTLAHFGLGTRNSTTSASFGDGAVQLQTMTAPTFLSTTASFDPGGSARVMDLQMDTVGDRLIVATGANPSTAELFAYDLASVSSAPPTLLASTELAASGSVVAIAKDYAYVALTNAQNQIAVVRLSDMSLQATWTLPGTTLINDIVYDAARNQLLVGRVLNASASELLTLTLTTPTTYTSAGLDLSSDVRAIAVTGATALLAMNNAAGEIQPITLAPLAVSTTCNLAGTALPNALAVSNGHLLLGRDAGSSAFEDYTVSPTTPGDCTYLTTHVNGQTTFVGNAIDVTPIPAQNTAIVMTTGIDATVNLTTFAATSFNPLGNTCYRSVSLGAYQYVACRSASTRLQILQGSNLTEELVYTDGLQNSWTIANSGNTTNTSNTFLVRTGAQSLLLNPAANGSTAFNKSLSTTGLQALDFYVNTVSPWAFTLYGNNAGSPAASVTLTNNTYGAAYQKNAEEGAFTDFPTANFAAMKAQAQSTSSYINAGAANYTLTAANLTAYAGKMIYVEFTNAARTLTVNFGGGGTFNVSIVMTGGASIILTNYNATTMNSPSTSWPLIASTMPITFTQAGNRLLTMNGLLFTNQKIDVTKHTGNTNLVINGSVVAATVDVSLIKTNITYTTDFNTNPLSATFFTPNYYAQNLSLRASAGNTVSLNNYLSGGIDKNPTTWQQVYIPVADLGSIGSTISSFSILDATGTNQSSIMIDDLRWVIAAAGGGGALSVWGSFTSPAQSLGSATAWKYIKGTVSGNGTITFRIRTASTQGGLSTATWVGPDGTSSSTYSSGSWQTIVTDAGASGTQWIQWKAYATGDSTQTPSLESVTILSQ